MLHDKSIHRTLYQGNEMESKLIIKVLTQKPISCF